MHIFYLKLHTLAPVSITTSNAYVRYFGDEKSPVAPTVVSFEVLYRSGGWIGDRYWMIGGASWGKDYLQQGWVGKVRATCRIWPAPGPLSLIFRTIFIILF